MAAVEDVRDRRVVFVGPFFDYLGWDSISISYVGKGMNEREGGDGLRLRENDCICSLPGWDV